MDLYLTFSSKVDTAHFKTLATICYCILKVNKALKKPPNRSKVMYHQVFLYNQTNSFIVIDVRSLKTLRLKSVNVDGNSL